MNSYTQFLKLLPTSPRLAGEVVDVDGDLYTIELPSGGFVTARSTGTFIVTDRVFVRNGLIEGLAPTLTSTTIEV
jgi:hypothetical protein